MERKSLIDRLAALAQDLRSRNSIGYKWLWQPALGAFLIFLILIAFHHVMTSNIIWAIGVSSLASTAYILFVIPENHVAKWWRVIGSYLIAVGASLFVRLVLSDFDDMVGAVVGADISFISFCMTAMFAVLIAIYVMILLDMQHPPAVGIALVMDLEVRNMTEMFSILAAVVLLALVKHALEKHLKNLT